MIMGAMASMLWWPAELCAGLARSGRFVIRYDNRDTGRSTSYEPGKPPYTSDDLVDDAVAVLDGYGIERAHIVGMSMGGALAQVVALHPARVATVTAISTTKLDRDPDLPGADPEYLEHAAAFERLDWADTQALAELLVLDARSRRVAAPVRRGGRTRVRGARPAPHDQPGEPRQPRHADRGEDRQGRLEEIEAPFLVIHGTDDPLMPYAHGVALARAVPGARLVTIDGGGHELHEGDHDQIRTAILEQTMTFAPTR